ncbi:GNAT family N-acetyltransferase [Arthrobacter sp. zg-Y820]|uniref:GNAT family N-acetyltransferase n=1 Tax=unclassified Arthrobacter TaxID=235627 RepID=UPI001E414FBC|nr:MULTISPECIES: GNAT family N-acetyltransferase [unclassified Arthrobacter]MCC9195762.1 GNAT family N-acetyltransferase [Arthrobacter sp. zg-Y820]MDK1278621.1 GNAT family N-acetyltransferase [Arthrobacter sp. zg.Y820]MDK1359781.1 GNAT family N-acetyltransferase [Arthrobacter sp. zg-Y1219]WIB08948.1 GNAT family N-acetyltransferase [Arthrobacter sp. zg-Y820]
MNLDPGTIAIIQLAWSRRLGLADDALAETGRGSRIYSVQEQSRRVSFVRLFGREVFCGPEWAADRARGKSTEELSRHTALASLSMEYGGRTVGSERLCFADSFPGPVEPADEVAVAEDQALAVQLERRCPPDDVAAAGLSGKETLFIVVDDSAEEPVPLAGAGYSIRDGILADISTLTAPDARRRGLGRYATSVAVEEAMAEGLIPQYRAPLDNIGAARTAAGAGFVAAGIRSEVQLSA